MLIYDPALDPYHSSVRILAIAMSSAKRQVDLSMDAARIADYYLVYPYKMISFKFPTEFRAMRAAVKATENPYRYVSGVRTAYEKMRPIFFAALSGLVAANLIDASQLKLGILKLTECEIPKDLAAAISRFQDRQTDVGRFVLSDLIAIPTNGGNGLKHRSGLMEYRYDIA